MANQSEALGTHIKGLREAKAAFQKLPEIVRDRMNEAIAITAAEIKRSARAHVLASPAIRTRTLYDAIDYTLNPKSGRAKVGVSNVTTMMVVGGLKVRVKGRVMAGTGGSAFTSHGAQVVRPSRYAHLVEFGARHMRAEPFMVPAMETERPHHIARCAKSGKAIERDMSAIGAHLL